MNDKKTFYSNGKLLITGEYLVLDGARSLAIPTKFGQFLIVEEIENSNCIHWKSIDKEGTIWFEEQISFSSIIKNDAFEDATNLKNTLIEILHQAYLLRPNFIANSNGFSVETRLTFSRNWGLGSSSTLLNNISKWLQIDAFVLNRNTFGGSGYDIACANVDQSIIYQITDEKPSVELVNFNPNFTEHLYFVYLNQKQSSKEAISKYRNKQQIIAPFVHQINAITSDIIASKTLEEFASLLEKHEIILSNILETTTVKENLFPDFDGVIKSLGAWGGDFVLVVSKNNPTEYFVSKEFQTILSYQEMLM